MKLTECRCTNCNAPLMIDEDVEFFTCEYCDEVIHRDLSAETPSEATGRMLAKKVAKYQDDLKKLGMLENRRQELQRDITEEKSRIASRNAPASSTQSSTDINGKSIFGVVIFIIGLIIGIPNIVAGHIGLGIIEIFVALIIGASMMGSNTESSSDESTIRGIQNRALNDKGDREFSALNYGSNNSNGSSVNSSTRLEMLNDKLKTTIKEFEEHKKSFDMDFIPARYRSQDAMNYLKDVLDCGRAYSMKEAYNLYEDHLDRVKQHQMQQQSLDLQRQNLDLQRERIEKENTTNDDSSGVIDALGTVASVAVGSAIVGKIGKEILKKL